MGNLDIIKYLLSFLGIVLPLIVKLPFVSLCMHKPIEIIATVALIVSLILTIITDKRYSKEIIRLTDLTYKNEVDIEQNKMDIKETRDNQQWIEV